MIQRVAVVGDVHGCVQEFTKLISNLQWLSLDQIWTVGDLVDRGPDSAGVVDACLTHGIKSVLGNHDQSILNHYTRLSSSGDLPVNPEKRRTLLALTECRHWDYLTSLPPIHVIDELGLILVHGGLWPKLPLYKQPHNVIRAQMIHPDFPGKCRWWGDDAELHPSGCTEEESRLEGYERWYRLYDHPEDVIFGHSTTAQPFVHKSKLGGWCIGVDNGACFGGSLTACVYDTRKEPCFVSVKAAKVYCPDTRRSFWTEDI